MLDCLTMMYIKMTIFLPSNSLVACFLVCSILLGSAQVKVNKGYQVSDMGVKVGYELYLFL